MSNNTCIIPGNVAPITLACASESQARFGCTVGVQITATPDGYRCEATDGRIAAVITGPNCEPIPDAPELRADGNGTQTHGVIQKDDFAGIIGYPGSRSDQRRQRRRPRVNLDWMLRDITVSIGNTRSVLATLGIKNREGLKLYESHNVEGRFPDIAKVLQKDEPAATARVDAKRLIQLLRVAESIQGTEHGTSLEIHPGKNKDDGGFIVLRVRNVDGQEMTGILVALVSSTDPKIT